MNTGSVIAQSDPVFLLERSCLRPDSCDIFCAVIDNYGDIGVAWRLAKQLAKEHELRVRLWVDDLSSFHRLCPEVEVTRDEQVCEHVSIRRWHSAFTLAADDAPAALVIETFSCKLPDDYLEAMTVCAQPPVWINLEHLSAESWVAGCHRLPSPHLRLPLTRYFFFPGFTPDTGGLLLERGLLERRDVFQSAQDFPDRSPRPQAGEGLRDFWRNLGVPERAADELRVSLFSYENPALARLLTTWAASAAPVSCFVPEGKILPQVSAFFGQSAQVGDTLQRGALRVHILPFVAQEAYDQLLWACDVNFVRGEDSCVRAQWAGKPFVWHIYPQHDGAHWDKLRALGALYDTGLPAPLNSDLWQAWNGEGDVADAWQAFMQHHETLKRHARAWSRQLESNNLALNLLDFWRQVGRIRAFEN